MKDILRNIFSSPYVILLLIVLAANWQLVLLQSGMEWDMMNFWMPWRQYMSECYNNGIVPVWNPYTQSGYPVHGDLQGPCYSPEAILVSFLFGQNIYVLNYCFVLYLFVAAVGMYKLAYFFTSKKEVSVLAGSIYSLCGFNVAHGHYFYIIVSVALIPFLFYYFFKLLNKGGYQDSLKFSLFIFWHITTGNPSFLIISGYLMAFVFIFYTAAKIRNRQITEWFSSFKQLSLVFGLSVLMALPVIYNAMQIIPLTTRKDGLDLAYAGDESFYFQNFIAFLVPLITITNVDLTGYEQELWSPYVGAFTVLFFVMGLFYRKTFFERALLFIGVAGLVIALGLQWTVYPFLHKYLPLFNVFRMPNLSLLFFLMLVIIMAAKYLSDDTRIAWLFSKKVIWLFSAAWLLTIFFMHYTAGKHFTGEQTPLFENYTNLRQWIYDASPVKITLFHLLLFTITILVLLLVNFTVKSKLRVLMLASLFDVFANYQLGGTARIFSEERATDMNEYFRRFPKNFSVPADMAMERVSAVNTGWPGYWLNTSVFLKQPNFPNSNNFELTHYLDLLLKKPKLSKNIFRNSYAFFADSLVSEARFTDSLLTSEKSVVSFKEEDIAKLRSLTFSNAGNQYACTSFLPNAFTFEVKSVSPAIFIVTQNYCPLWKFKLNGKDYKPIHSCNGSFPAFPLPAGEWKIEAMYSLPGFSALLLFSLVLFTFILGLIIYSYPSFKFKKVLLAGLPLLFGYCLLRFYLADPQSAKERVLKEVTDDLEKYRKGLLVNNTSLKISPAQLNTNFVRNEDIMRLYSLLDSTKENEFSLLNYDRYFAKEAEELINCVYGGEIESKRFSQGATLITFKKHASSKLVKDTSVNAESVINAKNAFSPGILLDSILSAACKPGDLLIVSAEMSAPGFDFPGVSLEIHFKDKRRRPVYQYANISTIKGAKREWAGIVFKLPPSATGIEKVQAYVWNPSVHNATVHRLNMRIYRP